MTTYYVGPGGNDGNSGLTWALRKLTLNGAENVPVVAGDTVYVGPGVYREVLTVDVSGSGGSPITYIGDVTGQNTDDVGGIVRVTGSDNDQSATRANCIINASYNYRTFRGFTFDTTTNSGLIYCQAAPTNWIVEDCVFHTGGQSGIDFRGAIADNIIRRCIFIATDFGNSGIYIYFGTVVNDTNTLIENCMFIGSARGNGVFSARIGGITVKNCHFMATDAGVQIGFALDTGQTVNVYNCTFTSHTWALLGTVAGEIVEDYNTFYGNNADRSNVNVGSNSVTYPTLYNSPILFDGIKYPWWFGELSEWSQVGSIVGTGTATDDLFGFPRSSIEAKSSWGAIEFQDYERETGTARGSSVASIKLADYGIHQLFVPVASESTTISVYAYREADYSGTAPRMVIKQPGQSDRTTTDAGAAATWNELTDTFTPAADPPYVLVELQSLNVNPSGNFDIFFDDLTVS